MKLDPDLQKRLKEEVAKKAADYVKSGTLVGLGTGSTATCFIHELCKRFRNGLKIQATSSSVRSEQIAREGGIPIIPMEEVTEIDLTVDSADEITLEGAMIKGGGGALLREKIVACSSKEVLIIVDESKIVSQLGDFGLPVEILPFGWKATITRLESLGYRGEIRMKDGNYYKTDNGNYIVDLHTPSYFENPQKHHRRLIFEPGVIETGLFFDLPVKVLVSYGNGEVKWMNG